MIRWTRRKMVENFNPRSPHGERRNRDGFHPCAYGFQSTLPARGATLTVLVRVVPAGDFNPRSPHGERQRRSQDDAEHPGDFNPRSPHGERRAGRRGIGKIRYFNPRSPHGERPVGRTVDIMPTDISIHAPRTGSDGHRAVRAGLGGQFQSTLPARGATAFPCLAARAYSNFNPRSPHGERHQPAHNHQQQRKFQSTLPARGATCSL